MINMGKKSSYHELGENVGKNKITSKPNPFNNKGKSSTTSESKEK